MGVKHEMVSESKSLCGRLVTQGTGADCKSCVRVRASKDAWAGKPAADVVAVATDVPGEPAPIELPQVGQWIMWAGFSYMVESRYSDGKMALRPYGGYETVIPDRPIAQLMAWGEAKWPAYACKTCGPRSSAWCTNCYECDHWGRPIVEATEVQATQVARATVAVIDVAAREAFELSKIDAVELPADPFRGHPDYAGEGWQVPYENLPKAGDVCDEEVWHGTDTCLAHPDGTVERRTATVTLLCGPPIKPPVRTCLGRRKRKATKRARRQAQGMKGGK